MIDRDSIPRPPELIRRIPVTANQVFLALVLFNLFAMTGDVAIAHAFNEFAIDTQYMPFVVGGFAALSTVIVIPRERSTWRRGLFMLGMWLTVFLGVIGFWWHLESQVIWRGWFSLKTYVYTAPLMAPLAYTGVAFIGLVVIKRSGHMFGVEARRWLYALIAGGSFGNASLSILDHARNGFIHPMEWVPIPVTIFAGVAFLWVAFRPRLTGVVQWTLWLAIVLQIIVGTIGWLLHVYGNLTAETGDVLHKIIYGPPIFSPLLLADIATFGMAALLFTFTYEREFLEKSLAR